MKLIANLKIGKKLLLVSIAGLIQMLVISALSLSALNDSNAASEKAQHYAHKMDVAENMDKQELEMALLIGKSGARLAGPDAEHLASLEKDYEGEIEYFREGATTEEDRGLIAGIRDCFQGWKKDRFHIAGASRTRSTPI